MATKFEDDLYLAINYKLDQLDNQIAVARLCCGFWFRDVIEDLKELWNGQHRVQEDISLKYKGPVFSDGDGRAQGKRNDGTSRRKSDI
jgi:hypothetical protein